MINIFGYISVECEGILTVPEYMGCLLAAFNAELYSGPCLRNTVFCKSQHLAINSSGSIFHCEGAWRHKVNTSGNKFCYPVF